MHVLQEIQRKHQLEETKESQGASSHGIADDLPNVPAEIVRVQMVHTVQLSWEAAAVERQVVVV